MRRRSTTAIGRIDTIVYRTEHPGSPRITRYWCAPTEGYIPLKVQQTMRDHVEWTMDDAVAQARLSLRLRQRHALLPLYFPPRSAYEVEQTSSDSKNNI